MSKKKQKWPKVSVKEYADSIYIFIRRCEMITDVMRLDRPTARLLAKRINEALKSAPAAPAK